MIIKYFKDDGTLIREETISPEEEKALGQAMANIGEWHMNAIRARARKEMDELVEEALRPGSKMLTKVDKAMLRNFLDKAGIIVCSPRELPQPIKKEIVRRITSSPSPEITP